MNDLSSVMYIILTQRPKDGVGFIRQLSFQPFIENFTYVNPSRLCTGNALALRSTSLITKIIVTIVHKFTLTLLSNTPPVRF